MQARKPACIFRPERYTGKITNSYTSMDLTDDHARFVAAVEAHPAVHEFRTHPVWGKCWSAAAIHRDPPVRVEFEHVTVLGTLQEARAASQHKTTWGSFLRVAPL